jgi:hypothetical protein
MKMENKKIFAIALSVTIIHFVLTSVMGHYIYVKIGTQVGQIVAGGFIETYGKSPQTPPQSDEEAKRIYRDMKNRSEDVIENWKLPLFLISLPIKPLLNPFLRDIRDTRMKMVVSKEISKDQFYKWGIVIDYTANFINSLCVGFLVYVILRLSRHYKSKT